MQGYNSKSIFHIIQLLNSNTLLIQFNIHLETQHQMQNTTPKNT